MRLAQELELRKRGIETGRPLEHVMYGGITAGGPGSGRHPGMLFPGLDDSPESHHTRMVHSLTQYDAKQSTKPGYNPYAIAHYMKGAQNVTQDVKNGMSHADAINKHFIGRVADRLHKHLGTGGKSSPY